MSKILSRVAAVVICAGISTSVSRAKGDDEQIASKTSAVDGMKLNYLLAGHGPGVILLHVPHVEADDSPVIREVSRL